MNKREFANKAIVFFLVVSLTLIIQPTLIRAVAINQVVPNLYIITAVTFGLLRGKPYGAGIGIMLGFGQDIFFGQVVGFYALIYFFLGYASGLLYRNFYKEGMLIPVSVIVAADIIHGFTVYFFTYLFRGRIQLGSYMTGIIIPEAVYTAAAGILVYKIYQVLDGHFEWSRWDKESD